MSLSLILKVSGKNGNKTMNSNRNKEHDIRKFLLHKTDIESQVKKIQSYSQEGGVPLYERNPDLEKKVQLLPDPSVPRGKFIPVPLALHPTYRAHPITLAAVKKDLFFADEDFLDLASPIICSSCQNEVDRQFWNFCPFCETSFSKEK